MRTGKSLLGLKVISETEGTDLGHVKDLIFDHQSNQVLALLMSDKDLFGLIDAQIIPWEKISHVGPDAITVAGSDARVNAGEDERVKNILNRNTALSGTRIYSVEGQELGTLADTCFDETTGQIEGYEVSGGFISDTLHGKSFLPAGHGLTIGADAALVEAGAVQSFAEQKQNQAEELSAAPLGRENNRATDYDIRSAPPEKQREFVIGEIAARDVVLPGERPAAFAEYVPGAPPADVTSGGEVVTGEVLVRRGETITAAHAARAGAAGVLPELVDAAIGGSGETGIHKQKR